MAKTSKMLKANSLTRENSFSVWALKALVSVKLRAEPGDGPGGEPPKVLKFLWVAWGDLNEESCTFEPLEQVIEDCPALYKEFKTRVNAEAGYGGLCPKSWAQVVTREFLIFASSSPCNVFDKIDPATAQCHSTIAPFRKRKVNVGSAAGSAAEGSATKGSESDDDEPLAKKLKGGVARIGAAGACADESQTTQSTEIVS